MIRSSFYNVCGNERKASRARVPGPVPPMRETALSGQLLSINYFVTPGRRHHQAGPDGFLLFSEDGDKRRNLRYH